MTLMIHIDMDSNKLIQKLRVIRVLRALRGLIILSYDFVVKKTEYGHRREVY